MANVFDQFDAQSAPNVFDQFDKQGPAVGSDGKPLPVGAAAFPEFLKRELANTDWASRNLAGFGTALSNVWEGAKQFVGQGDAQQIQANKIIAKAAPVGVIAGDAALAAIPFGLAGNTVKAAAGVGTALGALEPVQGDQSFGNVVKGKLINAVVGGASGAAGQAVANKVGGLVKDAEQNLQIVKAQNAPRTQTINDALDAGLVVPPSSANPTLANTAIESVGGKAATAQVASNRNSAVFDQMARDALHLPETAPLDPATMQGARDLAYQAGYKPVIDTPYVNWDSQFLNDLRGISPASKGGAVKSAAQDQIDGLLGDLASKGTWSGDQLVYDIRALRNQANANFRAASVPNGNPGAQELAHAQSSAADALEGLAQRNITTQGGSPDALELMRQARQYIAKSHDIEDAIVEGGGTIDPRVLAQKLQNGRPLSDELSVIGRFANNFPKASQPEKQVAGPAVSKLDLVMAMGAGALGSTMGPVGAALGAAAPYVAPKLVRAALLSKPSQNALRDIYRLGLAPRMANSLLQYAPVGGAVLGLNALSQ